MTACLLAFALAAAPSKLAVLQVLGGEGVPQSTAAAITEAVVAEVRRQSGAEVITQREIASILSLEKQKAMLGCETDACMAELGGALGADRLVAGDLAKLGESFLFHLRVVEVRKVRVSMQSDRRLRGGTIDDVLDVLPAMVGELFTGASPGAAKPPPRAPAQPTVAGAPTPGPSPAAAPGPTPVPESMPAAETAAPPGSLGQVPGAATTGQPLPSAWVEQREDLPRSVRDRLYVLTDDDGLVIALVPFQGIDAPFYAGDGEKLYRQRVVGGGQVGHLAVDRVFWEPRSAAEALLAMRGGKATLTCGKKTIPLRVVGAGGTRRVLAEAGFYAPPYRTVPDVPVPPVSGDPGSYGARLGTPCDGKL